jgi:aspartyl protease family protein
MATGFMRMHSILLCLALACAGAAHAADVALIGVIGDRAAVLSVNGGEPKTVKVGQRWNGIAVLSVEKGRATVEVEGVKRALALGQHHRGAASPAGGRQTVTLAADTAGHFVVDGAINGVPVRMLVDTGATVIALPGAEADRLGIDYRKGPRNMVSTAAGVVPAYGVRFDAVRLGGIELNGVEGVVIERGLSVTLLGMSFLNRVEMRREGDTMTLLRRF